jgi:rhodanese-related sulfurtransferase
MQKKPSGWIPVSIFLISLLSGPVSAQGPRTAVPPATVQELVAEAKAQVKSVSLAEAKEAIDRRAPVIILDVRDPWEYAGGHLPRAINVSRGTLEFKIQDKLPDTQAPIIVYCLTVGRAALAVRTLNSLGYRNAVLLDAPLAEWLQAGYPLEK